MNKKTKIILLASISLICFILDYFILPEVVVIQIGFNGQATNTVSKIIASIIPLALCVIGIVTYKNIDNKKGIAICVIGYFVAIMTIVMNLK